jgi:tetratricopeptide (TPR) repeat protein
MRRLALAGLLWLALAGATPLPTKPQPPDLAPLVPWATAPLAKPAVQVPRVKLVPPPLTIAPISPATVRAPGAVKPMAPMLSPRALPCVASLLRIASESLECARAKMVRGEYEEALRALDTALRAGGDREVMAESRYWYGEMLYLLGDYGRADRALQDALKDLAVPEYGPWALHASGWASLRLGDLPRAESLFRSLLGKPVPTPLDTWGRHGLGLSLYGLGRWAEAEKAWSEVLARRVPAGLERDLAFWHGEVLARMGQPERALPKLQAFTQGGQHPLLAAAQVRLGWLYLDLGRTTDAVAMFRAFLAGSGDLRDREWAEAGLALALVNSGDTEGAKRALPALDARRSALALPIRLRLAALALDAGRPAEAAAAVQETLAGNLSPAVRAWVLAVQGDVHAAQNERDEARTQFDLARSAHPGSEVAQYATFRLAQTNFELREFAQATADLRPLLTVVSSPELRVAVLLFAGEAAYHAGEYADANAAYRRALVDFPTHPQAAAVRLSLAWTTMRQGQRDVALREFVAFAQNYAQDARAPDALVLASELALAAGSFDTARELLDRMISLYPNHPRTELARLNRTLLLVRRGQAEVAEKELKSWVGRGGFAAFAGRAWVVFGVTHLAGSRGAEAAQAFTRAYNEGAGPLAKLGLGTAGMLQGRWDEATRALTEARDTGTPDVTSAAEYALAVVAFQRGRTAEFKTAATSLVDANPRDARTPSLLYSLVGLAVAEKDWQGALVGAKRLAADFPKYEAADDAFERIGAAAAAASVWPAVHEAYALLRQRFPQSPFVESSKVSFGEALLELGRAAEARRVLEEFVAASPTDPRAPRAWIALGRARTATGDRRGAVEAFDRAAKADGMNPAANGDAFSSYGKLLVADRRWEDARTVLGKLLASSEGPAAAEVAVSIADTWAGQGDHLAAAEYYMTAAYLTPDSVPGYKALLAAGRSFAAAKDTGSAAVVYGKLLASSDVPGDLAAAARRGLAELRR